MRSTAIGIAVWAVLALAPAARAGVVTYPGTPITIDDGQMVTGTAKVPDGTPPATDLDVVGVRVTGGAGMHNDKVLELGSARNGPDFWINLIPGCPSLNLDITFDDQAGSKFTGPGDCTATGTRRPALGGVLTTLLFFDAGNDKLYADGTWPLRFWDMAGPAFMAAPATVSAWGLRVTFEPMTFTVSAEKQPLKKSVEVEVKCSADCDVHGGRDARGQAFHIKAGAEKLKLPLKRKVRKRLRKKGGKAKLDLAATNDTGDAISRSLKVKLTK